MAADSVISDDSRKQVDLAPKIFVTRQGWVLGVAGDMETRLLLDLLLDCSEDNLPRSKDIKALQIQLEAILVTKKHTFMIEAGRKDGEWYGQIFKVDCEYLAIGSGQDFALGAMAHGATAEEAVWCACKHDPHSGGPVVVYQIGKGWR